MNFLYIFLGIIFFLIIFWIIFLYSFTQGLVKTFLRGEAPFVPTKSDLLRRIANCMDLDENSIVYDLGCGDARVLVACLARQPEAQFIGFERDVLPYGWAKFRLWAMGLSKKIHVHKKDFFDSDISSATHIYLYLGPKQMKKLAPALIDSIKKGTKIFSLQFEIPELKASQTIALGKEKLYLYKNNY